jgi:hypothetical protein
MGARKILQKLFRKNRKKNAATTIESEYQKAKKERAFVDKVQRENGPLKEYRDISAI